MATRNQEHKFVHSLLKLLISYLFLASVLQDARNQTEAAAQASNFRLSGETSSEIQQQHQDQERRYLSSIEEASMAQSPSPRFKSTISSLLLQNYPSSKQQSLAGQQETRIKLLRSAVSAAQQQQQVMPAQQLAGGSSGSSLGSSAQQTTDGDGYRCANYCSCSVIQVMDKLNGKKANLTQARCESPLFTDLLTIDRKTHIIHISLPSSSPLNEEAASSGITLTAGNGRSHNFRMPRLIQFNLLREIVIVNLRFEVCDSEVFKKGQKMRRLQLNHNRLSRISKACLRHLDKLIELNLDYNQLEELESALFNSLLNLKSLSIAYNQLTELAAHQFANLTNLVSLNLVGNSFKSINLQLFEPMQNSLRLLLLAKNQIKSFLQSPMNNQQTTTTINNININNNNYNNNNSSPAANSKLINLTKSLASSNSSAQAIKVATLSYPFIGVVFKNLIKLNVDENKFERIKLLQLHRFFNVKYLSIRNNNIATIRDKAFNGLKLVELNLAHNQLQSVSKCAFCNSTIKRLVLSYNNISLPQLAGNDALASLAAAAAAASFPVSAAAAASPLVPRPLALNGTFDLAQLPVPQAQQQQSLLPVSNSQDQSSQLQPALTQAVSSPNMLILSQSIFGPLFNQLEYLDLSNNLLLADQLELLLEPLLKLEYLNLASTGLDRYLPSPSLFKNLRQLKYLNLSHNQLDQVIAETVEPLAMLEVLDLSHNKFSELDESFLVTVDDMTSLKVINFGSNPWFCSQCKVAPLYDWILRSSIYNSTCIAPSLASIQDKIIDLPQDSPELLPGPTDGALAGGELPPEVAASPVSGRRLARGPQHYSLLVGDGGGEDQRPLEVAPMDLDLMLGGNSMDEEFLNGHYNLLASDYLYNGGNSFRESLISGEDDPSIAWTILQVSASSSPSSGSPRKFAPEEYCLKCEFPSELRSFNIHELQSNDFKFCAGAAPRFAASEPKIGLTLAIVIIGALFCIIIIVIVMYRKKSNTYYTNELETDQLDGSATNGKKPVFSISSDAEHQYGDNTDYSSPPMSQSYDSYSQDDDVDDDGNLDEEEEEDDDDEEMDEEEEDIDEEEELDEEEEDEDDDDEQGAVVDANDRLPIETVVHNQHPPNHHHHDNKEQQQEHNEKGKHRAGDNHQQHHVGYADDIEIGNNQQAAMGTQTKPKTNNDPQIQAVANAKRLAAAEQERRHQLAEYHRNERSTGGGTNNGSSQRTSQSQGSSLSPADRSASGPVPSPHRHSSSREPARRQTSAHQHHRHGSTRSRPGTAAVAAVAAMAATPPVEKSSIRQADNVIKETPAGTTSHSTTPSLVPSSTHTAHGSPRGHTLSSGGHSSSSNTGRATRTPAHHPPPPHPAVSIGSGSKRQMLQPGYGSQSNQSNNDSLDLGAVKPPTSRASGTVGNRSNLPSNESLVVGGGSQLSNGDGSFDIPGHRKQQMGKLNPTSASGQDSAEEHQQQQHPLSQDLRSQKSMMKALQQVSRDQTQTKAKLRPHSSGGQQHHHHHHHLQQQQRQSSAGSTSRQPSGSSNERQPSADQQHTPITKLPPPASSSTTGNGSRLGRQRFAVSKEQKSQPATEWAHLRQPVVEPPTAPLSLGVDQLVAHELSSNGGGGGGGPELEYVSAATLPAMRQSLGREGDNNNSTNIIGGHHNQAQLAKVATERRHSPSVVSDDATTADSLALEALSYTASELEEPPSVGGGALEMDNSSGSFGPDEFVNNNNNNNNNIINESNNRQHHHHQHHSNNRLQAAGGYQMRESHSSHSALTQTGTSSRDEVM